MNLHFDFPENYFMFETRVLGVPCKVVYTWVQGTPATEFDPGESDGPEELALITDDGYRLDWLMCKMLTDSKELDRVYDLCRADHESRAHDT